MTELSFKGKEFVYNHHLAVPHRPLVMEADKGIGRAALNGNLIIQGDNLHALKALMPMYAGKVDCIFIDPPYNTGNEGWCYNDKVNAPMIQEWLAANPIGVDDGLRHDKWCAMMWPRLRLLHELLAETGSLWMTLDDHEAHRGKLLLDEVFGEANFVANVVWQKKYSPQNDAKFFSQSHDHILAFAKNKDAFELQLLPRTGKANERYKNPDNDPRGPWKPSDLTRQEYRKRDDYEIISPKTGKIFRPPQGNSWGRPKEMIEKLIKENRIYFGPDGNSIPSFKRFLSEVKEGITAQTIFYREEVGDSQSAKKSIKEIFGTISAFETPKPIQLVERILKLVGKSNALVLDSFAGSATTAHAVLEANKRDGGNRRFILVEMEDYADTLTAERVRRVMAGYAFQGTQKTELLRQKLTWAAINKSDTLRQTVADTEAAHAGKFDKITKTIKDNHLVMTGESKITERTAGLGGAFTYCTLGAPIELDAILTGDDLPDWAGLGRVLFHMATYQMLEPSAMDEARFYLGAHGAVRVWLIYQPDLAWLKSPEAALTLTFARTIAATTADDKAVRHVVFAPSRHVGQKILADLALPVEFAPLPYALYRLERA